MPLIFYAVGNSNNETCLDADFKMAMLGNVLVGPALGVTLLLSPVFFCCWIPGILLTTTTMSLGFLGWGSWSIYQTTVFIKGIGCSSTATAHWIGMLLASIGTISTVLFALIMVIIITIFCVVELGFTTIYLF